MPACGRTWSLKGKTPVSEQGCRYKHLSVISAVTETGRFYYAIQEESFTGETVVKFLRRLSEESAHPLLAVWDNASIHRSQAVKDFLSSENAGHIHLAAQPGYSPELNADEQAWNHPITHNSPIPRINRTANLNANGIVPHLFDTFPNCFWPWIAIAFAR